MKGKDKFILCLGEKHSEAYDSSSLAKKGKLCSQSRYWLTRPSWNMVT